MKTFVNLFYLMMDIALSLVLYPVLYTVFVVNLAYGSIRYKTNFKEGFISLSKTYIHYIVAALKIHKNRIMGV